MFGQNPKRGLMKGDGHTLDIEDIFATLQGEGPFSGWPAIFVRLGGCNLACNFCDTEFESFTSQSLPHIATKIDQLSGRKQSIWSHRLVVITGGEPMRQPISLLCDQLLAQGYKVQIETNGTLYRPLSNAVDIVCSPKHQGQGYTMIRDDLLANIGSLKFIISASDPDYTDIADVGQHKYNIPVYIQPMDQQDCKKNQDNVQRVLMLASKNGYRVSLQLHKWLNIP